MQEETRSGIFIDGIALGGYRSFGKSVQRIGPFEKVNLFAGPNNSGKSNILRFLTRHLAWILRPGDRSDDAERRFTNVDRHIAPEHVDFVFGVGRRKDHSSYELIREQNNLHIVSLLNRLLESAVLSNGTACVWVDRTAPALGAPLEFPAEIVEDLKRDSVLQDREWNHLSAAIVHGAIGRTIAGCIQLVVKQLDPFKSDPPQVTPVSAIRRIGDKGTQPEDFSGTGLIERLAELQNPTYAEQKKKDRFSEINQFLREVVGNEEAKLEVPHDRETILVHMDGKTLPLASLGTGIHEVVILAAAATVLRDQVVCIEEPELHLHPVLQRKLIRYLQDKTTNQYFIATHSAHLLDAPDTAVFHVRLEDGETLVSAASDPVSKFAICADLGCRASDLMQSNCVIWVEGPSDRIYLDHWIRAFDPDLIEGVHYSIMFYGGRLLSHLSAKDPDVDDFISLRRLNRNLVVVMDSDRDNAGKSVNATKRRIQKEFNKGRGFAWITKGREIENYIEEAILREAVGALRPDLEKKVKPGQFNCVLPVVDASSRPTRRLDKIKLAHEVANRKADLTVLDLREKLQKLVKLIRKANE